MYTQKVYKGNSAYDFEEKGHGVTLATGSKTYQVMSDVWEDGNYAVVFDGERIVTVDWVESAVVDATPEVIREALAVERQRIFFRRLEQLTQEAWAAARELVRGCKARVVKGRKVPIGTEGVVVGFSDSQWGRKIGIATSDEKVEVKKGNRTFLNHKDVAWTAVGNVERVDKPTIDEEAIRQAAEDYANESVKRISWAKGT